MKLMKRKSLFYWQLVYLYNHFYLFQRGRLKGATNRTYADTAKTAETSTSEATKESSARSIEQSSMTESSAITEK